MDDWTPDLSEAYNADPTFRSFKWYRHKPTGNFRMWETTGKPYNNHDTEIEKDYPNFSWDDFHTGYGQVGADSRGNQRLDWRWFGGREGAPPYEADQQVQQGLQQHGVQLPQGLPEATGAVLSPSTANWDAPYGYDNVYPSHGEIPQRLYHVAPRSAREDILANGLDATGRTFNTGGNPDLSDWNQENGMLSNDAYGGEYEWRPEGIYMFNNPDDARQYAGFYDLTARRGNHDIWEINSPGVGHGNIIRDPAKAHNWGWDGDDNAYVTPYVAPQHLRLVDPSEHLASSDWIADSNDSWHGPQYDLTDDQRAPGWQTRVPFILTPGGSLAMGNVGDEHWEIPDNPQQAQELLDHYHEIDPSYTPEDVLHGETWRDHQGQVNFDPDTNEYVAHWPMDWSTMEPKNWITPEMQQRVVTEAQRRWSQRTSSVTASPEHLAASSWKEKYEYRIVDSDNKKSCFSCSAFKDGHCRMFYNAKVDDQGYCTEWSQVWKPKTASLPDRKVGDRLYFEYHCHEGHDSSDAIAWYHSHQPCTVLEVREPGQVVDEGYPNNAYQRAEEGTPRIYRVRFDDGVEWDVFEDELVDSPAAFYRPEPPAPRTGGFLTREPSARTRTLMDRMSKRMAGEGSPLPEPYASQPWHQPDWTNMRGDYHSWYGDDVRPDFMQMPILVTPDGRYAVGGPGQSHAYEEGQDWLAQDLGLGHPLDDDDFDYDAYGKMQGHGNVTENQYAVHLPDHAESVLTPEQIADIHAQVLKHADDVRKYDYDEAMKAKENNEPEYHHPTYGMKPWWEHTASEDWMADSTDSWHGPQSVDKFKINVPGEAPGMGGIGHEYDSNWFRSPCYCNVGSTTPHEWGPTCESGLHPTMEHEAGQNGPLPPGMQITEFPGMNFVAWIDDGSGQATNENAIGRLLVDRSRQIHVNTLGQYQRRGVATSLLQYLQQHYPEFVSSHSNLISDEGLAWAQQQQNVMWPQQQTVAPRDGGMYDYTHYASDNSLVQRVRNELTPDLLKPQFKDTPFPGGHCYVATEALYHLMGGPESGYKPMRMRMPDGVTHWWLQGPDGEIIDATHDQFSEPVPYDQGKGGGFLTSHPSNRAREVMRRVQGSWKLARPPAEYGPQFKREFEGTPDPNEWTPSHNYITGHNRGHDWEINWPALQRLNHLPNWPLKHPINVQVMTPEHRNWTNALGTHDWGGTRAGHQINLHPFMSPEQANETLWHELQHAYQEEEGRMNTEGYDYTYNDPGSGYWKHPVEEDARAFSQHLKDVPLITRAKEQYEPNWLPNEMHLDMGDWDDNQERWLLDPFHGMQHQQAQVQQFRQQPQTWRSYWQTPEEFDAMNYPDIDENDAYYDDMMRESADTSNNWVWLDGDVAFGGEFADIAMKMCQVKHYDDNDCKYISNMIARGLVPEGHNVACGTVRQGYPQIWISTVDRNAVWDDVARELQNDTMHTAGLWPDEQYENAPWNNWDRQLPDDYWDARRPYIVTPDDKVLLGDPGTHHDLIRGYDADEMYGDPRYRRGEIYNGVITPYQLRHETKDVPLVEEALKGENQA